MTKKIQWSMILIIVFVLLGTAWLMFSRAPEERVATSSDGQCTVWVIAEETVLVSVVPDSPNTDSTAVLGSSYVVTPSQAQLSTEATIRIRYTEELARQTDPADMSLGWFDPAVNAWRLVPSRLDRDKRELTAQTGHLSRWALLRLDRVELPDRVLELAAELVAMPPAWATGYRVEAAYRTGDDWVMLPDALGSGGCGGVYQRGASEEYTAAEQSLLAKINGVEQTADFRVVVKWEIGQGCAAGEQLSSLNQI